MWVRQTCRSWSIRRIELCLVKIIWLYKIVFPLDVPGWSKFLPESLKLVQFFKLEFGSHLYKGDKRGSGFLGGVWTSTNVRVSINLRKQRRHGWMHRVRDPEYNPYVRGPAKPYFSHNRAKHKEWYHDPDTTATAVSRLMGQLYSWFLDMNYKKQQIPSCPIFPIDGPTKRWSDESTCR